MTATADEIDYVKMNGLGNEILVVDARAHPLVLTEQAIRNLAATAETAFEQLMVLGDSQTAGIAATVKIYNSDGSEAGACGNGMRCVAWLEAERSGRNHMRFMTLSGILTADVTSIDRITVDMGEPKLRWNEIPLRDEFYDTSRIELQIGPIDAPVLHSPAVVNVGNPHAVFFVDDVSAYDLGWFGPMLENHPLFPERANISLAQVDGPDEIIVRTWERGAGLTRACGSAACAVLVSAVRRRLSDRKANVHLPGGVLEIEWASNNHILMTGPAEVEHDGRFTLRSA